MDIQIFDNGGKTLDRYTVIIKKYVYAMSANALSPQGVNRYLCNDTDLNWEAIGEPIGLEDVPEAVRKAIENRYSNVG
jgi:hypothetical protein